MSVMRLSRGPLRHIRHVALYDLAAMAEWDRPVGIGSPITVDTTIPADIHALSGIVRTALDDH